MKRLKTENTAVVFRTFEDAWEHVFLHLAEIGDYDPESPGEYYVERICAWEI